MGSCGKANSLCSATTASVKASIADPKCKASASCMDCVARSVVSNGQQGTQCQAASATQKSNTSQKIASAFYMATAITCSISCGITLTVYGSSLERPLSQACGALGLANSVLDIGLALTSGDIAGGMMSAISGIASAQSSIALAKSGVGLATKTIAETAKKKAVSMVCINAGIYLATAVMKVSSQQKIKKAADASCSNVESLAGITGTSVQSCLAAAGSVRPPSSALPGLYAATAETFPTITTSDIEHNPAIAGDTGKFMQAMKADLDTAVGTGKVDLNALAKRLDDGESVSSIAAEAGAPPALLTATKEFEEKVKAGEKSPLLASLSGGSAGYSASGTTTVESGGNAGPGDLSFGGGNMAAPGEGAASLDIEKKSEAIAPTVGMDGDVFHGAYSGTIFDIVTSRLKAQKGDYAELDPEGRMNRLFNGYGEPGKKSARSPASDKSAK
jgi:hypothetical protein